MRTLLIALAMAGVLIKAALPYEASDSVVADLPAPLDRMRLEARVEQSRPERYTVYVLAAGGCEEALVAVPAASQEIAGIVRYRLEQPEDGLYLYGGELSERYPAARLTVDHARARLLTPFGGTSVGTPWFVIGTGDCSSDAALRRTLS